MKGPNLQSDNARLETILRGNTCVFPNLLRKGGAGLQPFYSFQGPRKNVTHLDL
jgi:hypothetical protein